jgi:hypothetical protein
MNNFTFSLFQGKSKTRVTFFSLFFILLLNTQGSWGQDYKQGFENGIDSWANGSSTTSLGISALNPRTGVNSYKASMSSAGSDRYVKRATTITSISSGTYIHVVGWIKATNTGATASFRISTSSPLNHVSISNSVYSRISHSYAVTSSTTSFDLRLNFTNTSFAETIYPDDIILYTSESSSIDLTRPTSVTSLTGTTSGLSWSNGSDIGTGATGVKATLIFKRTAGTVGANDLSLNDQGVYSLTATTGPSLVGNWTLQKENVLSSATSDAIGIFTSGEEYAIVHRDLAYNYSAPTYVVIPSSSPTSTTWDGTAWSNGTPTSSLDAIIAGDFNTAANGVFTARTLTVNANKSFTINSDTTITVAGAITDNGNLIVQSNGNLVQTDVSATNSGSIIVNRNSANIQLYDYTLWSSPVAGQKLKTFSPDTLDARFYTYNSSTNLYNVVPAPATTDFAAANGYLIRAPNTWTAGATAAPFSGAFTGVPNNGTITLSGLTSGNYYAVGNPYPSTISVSSFYSANPTAGALYFWRKTNGASGSAYASRNSTGATASGGYTPSTDIGVGQGFIVVPGASTLSYTNAMRATPSTTATFLRTTEYRSRFWLNLTNTSGLFSQMLVGYMAEATSGIDNAIDGKYINDSPIALTSLINSEEYTIQGRALPFLTSDSVPLGFKTDVAGNYSIAIDHLDGLFSSGQAIYLKDNLLNTVTDLGAGSYSFASAIGTFNSRFEIVYQRVLGGVNNLEFSSNSVVVYNDNGDIKINSGSTIMEQVRVYDLQGRFLVEKKQINANETKISTMAVNQVLLLEITAANGTKVTKKIIQ